MSVVADNTQVTPILEQGASAQAFLPASLHGLTGPIAASGNVKSNIIPSYGWQKGAVGLQSNEPGALSVQRYLDKVGTIPVGAVITGTIVASTPVAVTWSDGLPYGSFQVTVTNTGGTQANLTDITVLLQGQ